MARNGWEWPAIAGNGYGLLGVGWNGEEIARNGRNCEDGPGMASDGQEWLGIARNCYEELGKATDVRNCWECQGIAWNSYGLLGIARNCTGSWHSGKSGKVVSCKSSKIKAYLEK